MRGGDSLASSWLRHHPPKRSPNSLLGARARRFASRADRFSRSLSCWSSSSACWPSSTAARAGPAAGRRSSGQRRHQHRRALAPSLRHLHLRHVPAEDHRHARRDRCRRPGQHRVAQRQVRDPRHPQPQRRDHPLPPVSTKSSGNRAKLGVFLDSYNIKLTDTELVMPPEQGGEKWSTKTPSATARTRS